MKNLLWMLMCVFASYSLLGQSTNNPQRSSGSSQAINLRTRSQGMSSLGSSSHGGNNGLWLERKVTNPEYMQKLGITGEQAKKLNAGWKIIEEQNKKLEEEIHLLARQQAELAKQVLAQSGSDTKNLMTLVEKIGTLRIEQAKLAMQRVILIRDHLTPEQRTKLNALLEDDQKKWRAAREEVGRRHENDPEAGKKK